MRKLSLVFLALIVVVSFSAEARNKGGQQSSTKTVLVGINIGGLAEGASVIPGVAGTNYYVPTLAQITDYHQRNLDHHMRLAVLWERLQPTLGGALDSTYAGYIDQTASYAASLGGCIQIDIHNYGAYNGVQIGAGVSYAQFADLWTKIATRYVGNPGVCGYDDMNEWNSMSSSAVVPAASQAMITAVRAVDTAMPIYIEGDAYTSSYAWTNTCARCGGLPTGGWSGNTGLASLVDPNHNLVFEAHAYGDSDGSGTYATFASGATACSPSASSWGCAVTLGDVLDSPTAVLTTDIFHKRYTPFVNWCVANNLTCEIGESGVPNDDPTWLTALDAGISYLQQNNIQLTYWNADGVNLTYPLNVDPRPNGQDALQMAVLSKYTNPYLPTSYGLSGPQRGTSGVASTSFSAPYNGYVNKAVTITPSDSSAGGTFTPSSITFSAGSFNGIASFTYTPPGTATYAISANNNIGWTAPSPVGFSTQADIFLNADVTPVNLYFFTRIYAPYIGPCVTLRRASDNATATFWFTSMALNAPCDQASAVTWANGSNMYIVTRYDQSPNSNNLTIPTADGSAIPTPITTSDQPQFIPSCQNSLPCVLWSSNRMEAASPYGGATGQAVFAVIKPTSSSSQTTFLSWGWPISPDDTINGFGSDLYSNSTMPSTQMKSYTLSGAWNVVGASYSDATGGTLMNNGVIVGHTPSGGHTASSNYRNYMTAGFQVFSAGRFAGYDMGAVVLNTSLTDAQMATWESTIQSLLSVSSLTSYTFSAATLNQSTSAANTAPWEGVAGTGVGEGFGQPLDASYGYWANRGANIYRYVVAWEAIEPNLCTGNTTLDPTTLATMDHAVATANAAGMDILIDLHNYGSYNYNHAGTCGSPPAGNTLADATTQGYFVNYWDQIAAHYASNPKVKFDEMNEPTGVTDEVMMQAAQASITSLRGLGYTPWVFVEFGTGNSACTDVVASTFTGVISGTTLTASSVSGTIGVGQVIAGSGVTAGTYVGSEGTGTGGAGTYILNNSLTIGSETMNAGGGPAFKQLTDSASKIVLDCHQYVTPCGYDGCGATSNNGEGLGTVTSATTYVQANNIPLFWGEAGIAAYSAQQYTETKAALDYIAAHLNTGTGGWMGWVAWGAGTWGESYTFKQDPNAFPSPYGDRPTADILNKYFTGGSWKCSDGTTGSGGTCSGTWPAAQFP